MNKIICIGSACKDIFFPTGEGTVLDTPEDLMSQKKISFELGAKYKIEERHESLGGCAANVAAGLARLGADAKCRSKIGDDVSGAWIMSELEKNGVATDLVSVEKGFSSDMSAIIVEKHSGDRVIFSNQKVNGKMEITPEKMKDADWYFIGDLHGEWEKHLDEIFKSAKDGNIRVAINPRQSNIHDNVKKVLEAVSLSNVVFLNKDETIEVLAGAGDNFSEEELNSEEFLAKKLKELGPETVAITDGVRGAWGYDGTEVIHVLAIEDSPVDTTGAGDAFASGFLGAHIKGKPLRECLEWGAANAANSVRFFGGVAGLLDEKGILENK